ncbi:C-terminal processing peptidase-3. Serine peptidase. MEROPS family S41A [Cohaesibacter sp. ES.047]|uniref:S41 family peptidase n=1 Tax=Cohaesibacter sp. ES.047 TaxID=1798205 RepID=UPI000BB8422A|nr:S41 family peptidase [Cohaesibacter sp. ES.047]SNY90680.1 C-terminal processing peptidase-3. Serine peptidase. MEROPS family S41A [Cohaesibacter sp. ES.047]
MIRKLSLMFLGALMGASLVITFAVAPWETTSPAHAAGSDTYRNLSLFGDVFERVKREYVEQPEDEELIASALNGMLSALDPHSSYLSPKNFEDMAVETSGEFGGLGIQVTLEDGLVKVISPIDDTPAHKAGMLADDFITHLDGQPVRGLTLNEAVDKMRGKPGSKIELTVIREGIEKPFKVEITREVIKLTSVRSKAFDDIGYVRITQFNGQAFAGLKDAIGELEKEIGADKIKGFILDLRSNPGGQLDQSIAISDTFLDQGEIVSTRGRNKEEDKRFYARAGDMLKGRPMIVLINGGSASASEIVAGALYDHGRATLIGSKSFGKGSVQTIIPLGNNGAIRLTTARYYTPSGRSIQAKGIVPDIFVKQELPEELKDMFPQASTTEATLKGHLENEEDVADTEAEKSVTEGDTEEKLPYSPSYVPVEAEKDTQLQYALKLIHGEETNEAYPPKVKKSI